MTKTIRQTIEELFVGKRVRFPSAMQKYQKKEVHTITDLSISGEVYHHGGFEQQPWEDLSIVFTTKTKGQGEKENTAVLVTADDEIEFVDEFSPELNVQRSYKDVTDNRAHLCPDCQHPQHWPGRCQFPPCLCNANSVNPSEEQPPT